MLYIVLMELPLIMHLSMWNWGGRWGVGGWLIWGFLTETILFVRIPHTQLMSVRNLPLRHVFLPFLMSESIASKYSLLNPLCGQSDPYQNPLICSYPTPDGLHTAKYINIWDGHKLLTVRLSILFNLFFFLFLYTHCVQGWRGLLTNKTTHPPLLLSTQYHPHQPPLFRSWFIWHHNA